MLNHIIIEGLDRLGKSTLAEGIEDKLGCFIKLHFGKPPVLDYYARSVGHAKAKEVYQRDSFEHMFALLDSDSRIILDRAHLGEAVYAKRYRGYDGSYVFDLESVKRTKGLSTTLLVLLVNHDQALERSLVDDGESFDWSKRSEEQDDFITAFNRSRFRNKMILPVGRNGSFVPKDQLVAAVLQKYTNP